MLELALRLGGKDQIVVNKKGVHLSGPAKAVAIGVPAAALAIWVGAHYDSHGDVQTLSAPGPVSTSSTVPDTFKPGDTTPLHNDSASGQELVAPDGTTFQRIGANGWLTTHNETPETFINGKPNINPLALGDCTIFNAGANSSLNAAEIVCSFPQSTKGAKNTASIRHHGAELPQQAQLARVVRFNAPQRPRQQQNRRAA